MPYNAREYDALKWALYKAVYRLALELNFERPRPVKTEAYRLVKDYAKGVSGDSSGVAVSFPPSPESCLEIALGATIDEKWTLQLKVALEAEDAKVAMEGNRLVVTLSPQLERNHRETMIRLCARTLSTHDWYGSGSIDFARGMRA